MVQDTWSSGGMRWVKEWYACIWNKVDQVLFCSLGGQCNHLASCQELLLALVAWGGEDHNRRSWWLPFLHRFWWWAYNVEYPQCPDYVHQCILRYCNLLLPSLVPKASCKLLTMIDTKKKHAGIGLYMHHNTRKCATQWCHSMHMQTPPSDVGSLWHWPKADGNHWRFYLGAAFANLSNITTGPWIYCSPGGSSMRVWVVLVGRFEISKYSGNVYNRWLSSSLLILIKLWDMAFMTFSKAPF